MNDKYATGATYAGSFVTVFGGAWTLNEIAIIGGFAVALCSFLYNIFCKERQHRADLEYKHSLLAEIKQKETLNLIQDNSNGDEK